MAEPNQEADMEQAARQDLYRVEPDPPRAPPGDMGIHSWPFGSYAPIGFYRSAPIVRFAGTIILQLLLNLLAYDLLILEPGAATVAAGILIALVLGARAWLGWLRLAPGGWKIATIGALAANFAYLAFLALAPSA